MKVSQVLWGYIMLLPLAFLPSPASADETNPFYEKDSVRDMFNEDIYLTGEGGIIYVRAKKDDSFDVRPEEEKIKAAETIDPRQVPGSVEELIAKFGNPMEPKPVLGQIDAPTPFQGMMAALEMGHEGLAMAYARQYHNYLQTMNERSSTVATMMEHLNGEEARAARLSASAEPPATPPGGSSGTAGTGAEDRAVMLNAKANELMEKARQLESAEQRGQQQDMVMGLNAPQAHEAYSDLAKRVPVAKDGGVDVYFFHRANEKGALAMGREVQAFYTKAGKDRRVNFIGMTMEKTSQQSIDEFRAKTGATYPIGDGTALAKTLSLAQSPSIVFFARSSGKSFTEEGVRSEAQLTDILRTMQGGN